MKNIDNIKASPFPGEIKDSYLDPTELINDNRVLTFIDGFPLFATYQAAIQFGERFGLEGYHTHMYRGRVGYMAGETMAKLNIHFDPENSGGDTFANQNLVSFRMNISDYSNYL